MLVSLVSSAGIAALGGWAKGLLPGWAALLYVINLVFSVGFTTVLFAMIFKLMPQAQVSWRDVWVGAGVTAVLFEIGKTLISLYIGKSSVTSSFAAAGSLVVLLIWVYYSAQIFLLGAEFTWAYANAHGSRVGHKNNRSASTVPESGKKDGGKKPPTLVAVASETGKDGAQASQAFPVPADASDDASTLRPYSDTGHASLKQRAIVYAGSLAALMALRLLLKRKARNRRP